MRISPRVRFAAACLLFVLWIGRLIHLAATTSGPAVLSRPQLLVSEIDVLAYVEDVDKDVEVKEVLPSRRKDADVKPGVSMKIENLRDCRRLPHEDEDPDAVPLDFQGAGLYLLPLRSTEDGRNYLVAVVPRSPGYPPYRKEGPALKPTPRMYRSSDEVLRQHREFRRNADAAE